MTLHLLGNCCHFFPNPNAPLPSLKTGHTNPYFINSNLKKGVKKQHQVPRGKKVFYSLLRNAVAVGVLLLHVSPPIWAPGRVIEGATARGLRLMFVAACRASSFSFALYGREKGNFSSLVVREGPGTRRQRRKKVNKNIAQNCERRAFCEGGRFLHESLPTLAPDYMLAGLGWGCFTKK